MGFKIPLIVANWKMNKNCDESIIMAQNLLSTISYNKNIEVCIAPAFTSLYVVSDILKKSHISIAAQDVFWEKFGAFTGEISADMLSNIGCNYVIIGHSERRQLFYDTDQVINKKIKITLSEDMSSIFCIGESNSDREMEKMFSVLDKQIRLGLNGVESYDLSKIIIAYEPIWAIGTGRTANNYQIEEIHMFIRSCLEKLYSSKEAKDVRIIYGGSVNLGNIEKIMSLINVDGVLVGGASLDVQIFSNLVHLAQLSVLGERG